LEGIGGGRGEGDGLGDARHEEDEKAIIFHCVQKANLQRII